MREKDQQKTTDVQYELDGTKGKIVQVDCGEGRVQGYSDRTLRRARRLKASIDRVRGGMGEKLQPDGHRYLKAAFAAVEASTTNHRGRLGR